VGLESSFLFEYNPRRCNNFHRRRGQDDRYNAKWLHHINTSYVVYNTPTPTERQGLALYHLPIRMARRWYIKLLGHIRTKERNSRRLTLTPRSPKPMPRPLTSLWVGEWTTVPNQTVGDVDQEALSVVYMPSWMPTLLAAANTDSNMHNEDSMNHLGDSFKEALGRQSFQINNIRPMLIG
jgi:hypothetical protein